MNKPPKRIAGFLVCKACERSIPYQGYTAGEAPDTEVWPEHRCAAARLEVRAFTRFTTTVPALDLPPPPPPEPRPRPRRYEGLIG